MEKKLNYTAHFDQVVPTKRTNLFRKTEYINITEIIISCFIRIYRLLFNSFESSMTHIEYNPGAEGTGIFVLDPLKACFHKRTKQKIPNVMAKPRHRDCIRRRGSHLDHASNPDQPSFIYLRKHRTFKGFLENRLRRRPKNLT